jgi:hypothetical protein
MMAAPNSLHLTSFAPLAYAFGNVSFRNETLRGFRMTAPAGRE